MDTEQEVGGVPASEIEARRQAAEANAVAYKERKAKRQEAREGSGSGDDEKELPITESAMLGLPEPVTVGTLRLLLKAPVIKVANRLYGEMLTVFPDIIVYAALSDRKGKGIEIAKAVSAGNAVIQERLSELKESGQKNAEEITALAAQTIFTEDDAEEDLENFTKHLGSYSRESERVRYEEYLKFSREYKAAEEAGEDNGPMPVWRVHLLERIAGILAQFALPQSLGADGEPIRREDLADLLISSLRPRQFADLLRAMLRAASGSDTEYDGDAWGNFGTL